MSLNNINRHQRRINRRNRRQIRRITSYRRRASNNNIDILDLIARLPSQITDDPFASQLFNGSFFNPY